MGSGFRSTLRRFRESRASRDSAAMICLSGNRMRSFVPPVPGVQIANYPQLSRAKHRFQGFYGFADLATMTYDFALIGKVMPDCGAEDSITRGRRGDLRLCLLVSCFIYCVNEGVKILTHT